MSLAIGSILYTFLPIPSGLIIFIISLHKNLDKKYYTGIYYINVLYRDLLHKRIIQFFVTKNRWNFSVKLQFHGKMKNVVKAV